MIQWAKFSQLIITKTIARISFMILVKFETLDKKKDPLRHWEYKICVHNTTYIIINVFLFYFCQLSFLVLLCPKVIIEGVAGAGAQEDNIALDDFSFSSACTLDPTNSLPITVVPTSKLPIIYLHMDVECRLHIKFSLFFFQMFEIKIFIALFVF